MKNNFDMVKNFSFTSCGKVKMIPCRPRRPIHFVVCVFSCTDFSYEWKWQKQREVDVISISNIHPQTNEIKMQSMQWCTQCRCQVFVRLVSLTTNGRLFFCALSRNINSRMAEECVMDEMLFFMKSFCGSCDEFISFGIEFDLFEHELIFFLSFFSVSFSVTPIYFLADVEKCQKRSKNQMKDFCRLNRIIDRQKFSLFTSIQFNSIWKFSAIACHFGIGKYFVHFHWTPSLCSITKMSIKNLPLHVSISFYMRRNLKICLTKFCQKMVGQKYLHVRNVRVHCAFCFHSGASFVFAFVYILTTTKCTKTVQSTQKSCRLARRKSKNSFDCLLFFLCQLFVELFATRCF